MASKLLVFNAALLLCGERKLASLTEAREARRLLDDVYDGGAVKTCLEAGFWNFGTRSAKIEYDTGVAPDFGFQRAFAKPSDWVRTSVVSSDEYFKNKMTDQAFSDEAGYWFADVDEIYVRFVSDGASYGNDLGSWTESFARYFEAYLASRIVWKLTRSSTLVSAVQKEMMICKKGAASKDAMDSGTSMSSEGSWNRARRGRGGSGRRDGGSRANFIG
jgi:hypothetical protein